MLLNIFRPDILILANTKSTMFQQFYEPNPALKEFVNYIMINEIKFEAVENSRSFSIPPLPEHSLLFYVRDCVNVEDLYKKKKKPFPVPS